MAGCENCDFRSEHPLIERRLTALERWRDNLGENRVEDIKHFTEQLGEIHEKVNRTANKLAGLDGRMVAYGLLTTGAGALVMTFLLYIMKRG